jgi:hypothetical protein
VNAEPDFYLYGGDGEQSYFTPVRSCRMCDRAGPVLVVRIDPPLPGGCDVIGLTDRHTIPFLESLETDGVGGAVVHRMRRTEAGDFAPVISVGIGIIYKRKPTLRSDGTVVWTGRNR